ncbi:LLM class flavin-dependent oxidoreductase [Silvimonas sp.]|uniref:LLM class flavin-dependent oxidoreductase n=1 Tax=Silvimonas sp. TaxID=2650811 RepID=UPI002849C3E9|nr:LLM class flavin-dependent oxidoreductase [Silvimonas sp.]MDR3426283.1 LLM class flavin-dependent oxidoreductase [Silvimonas sp.]
MKTLENTPISVLDLSPIVAGSTPTQALANTLDLAQHADRWGFNRYWLAEHHGMRGIASAATSVVIGHVAGGTKRIRVGSGGIMLPNHAPLVIAEQFGTLESLYPGRIDLGLGRAPGTDQATMRALRRDSGADGDQFPQMLEELRAYFRPDLHGGSNGIHAVPGEGLDVPIWLLGSSGFSAQLAGYLGLPFAFAGQFAPRNMKAAFDLYRHTFRPSRVLEQPYAMAGINVIAADTDEHAQFLATSAQRRFVGMIRGNPGPLEPPVESMDGYWEPHERAAVQAQLGASIIGSPVTVRAKLREFLQEFGVDEIMANAAVSDHAERLHSYEIVSQVCELPRSL